MAKVKPVSTTVPGGAYIQGGELREDDHGIAKHFGGRVVNAEGEVLVEFDDDEENTGVAAVDPDAIKAREAAKAKLDQEAKLKAAADKRAADLKKQQEAQAAAAAAKKAAEEAKKSD